MKYEKYSDLRVVIVTPAYHVLDGVSITLKKVVTEIELQGGEYLIATADVARGKLESEKNVIFIESVPLPYDKTESYSICKMIPSSAKKKILDFKPTVIHVTSPDCLGYSVSVWARKARMPVMATWHSNIPNYLDHQGPIQRNIFKPMLISLFSTIYSYPLLTLVPQENLCQELIATGYKDEATKNELGVWGRGVNISLFNPAKRSQTLRMKLGCKPNESDTVVILWVGRCVVEKQPRIFIDVMKKLGEKHPGKVIGWVVGRGAYFKEMSEVENVRGLEWKGREELAEIYASSDILLFPSGVETFGNVTLEGMSSGIPALVDKGCSSHLVENEVNGYTCTNFEEYYTGIEKLVLDESLRKKFGKEGRCLAETKWENRFVLQKLLKVYLQMSNLDKEDIPRLSTNVTMVHAMFDVLLQVLDKGMLGFTKVLGTLVWYMPNLHKDIGFSLLAAGAGIVGYNYFWST
eukprot:augustus_masked-scaffold_14-processed-gene-6.8-mRNA-1 protein AED:1.00 eAED:1.00 QI:0/-1/0/0/-1/1/1/0/463